ncbi:hypothetical protein Q3C01_11000 [Bradyrhizobium sp. UFLA05-109]
MRALSWRYGFASGAATRAKPFGSKWTMGRQCKLCEIERQKRVGPLLKPEMRAKAIEAMKRRATYVRIRKIVGDMNALYRTRARDPEFDAICRDWAAGARERMGRRTKAKNGCKQYEWVRSLIPRHIADEAKDEIVSMVFLAHRRRVFNRKPFGITKTPKRINEFVSEYFKQNPTKAYGRADSPWSLDAPIGQDTSTRLVDTVSEGLW